MKSIEHENSVLLEQHSRMYEELRETKRLLKTAVLFIERQSGAEHQGNLTFKRDNGTFFWIGTRGKVYQNS